MEYEDEEQEEPTIDYDLMYETMRDNTCEALMQETQKMFHFFVKSKNNKCLVYYKNNAERFWEHLKSDCDFQLKLLKENGGNNNGRK
jgi:hypothetical protein